MLKHLAFWVLSIFCFAVIAASSTDISQQGLLKAKSTDLVIVDVRTPEEFMQGHVPNAINIPLSDIIKNTSVLASSKEKQLVLYCRSGRRAGKAADILSKSGFDNIQHLEGDMNAWIEAGLPIEK